MAIAAPTWVRVVAGVAACLTACSQAPVQAPDPPDGGDPTIGHWDERFRLPGLEGSMVDGLEAFADALAVLPDGSIVVGGLFDHAIDAPVHNVARFDGASWHALGDGLPLVHGLAVDDAGVLWALTGGYGATTYEVARWDGASWTIVEPVAVGWGIAAVDGGIAIYGQFDEIDGVSAAGVAVWDGSGWSGRGLSAGSSIDGLARTPDGFCVAGVMGVPSQGLADRNRLACWNGSTWTAIGDPMPGQSKGRALARGPDATWWIGGGTWDGPTGYIYGVGFLAADGTWELLDGGMRGRDPFFPETSASAIAFDADGGVIVAGDFATVGPDDLPSPGLARWSPQLGWQAFNPATWTTLYAGTYAMVTDGDRIHLAGAFAAIGPTPASDVATLEADGTVTAWVGDAVALGVNGGVADIVASGDSVLVPGRLTAGSIVAAPLASFDHSWHRMADPPLDDHIVDAAIRSDGSLVISGDGVYAWNGTTWDTLVATNGRPSPIFIDTDDAIYYRAAASVSSYSEIRRIDGSGDASLGTVAGEVVALTAFGGHLVAVTYEEDSGDTWIRSLEDGKWSPILGGPNGVTHATWSPALGLVVASSSTVMSWDGQMWNPIETALPQRPITAIAASTTGVFIATSSFDAPMTGGLEFADSAGLRRLGTLGDGNPYALVPTRGGVFVATAISGRSQFGFFDYD